MGFQEARLGTLAQSGDVAVVLVDGDAVRDLDIEFALGGNHYRYDFIPENEVWVETREPGVAYHELVERFAMKHYGLGYDAAHAIASTAEAGFRETLKPDERGT